MREEMMMMMAGEPSSWWELGLGGVSAAAAGTEAATSHAGQERSPDLRSLLIAAGCCIT